jgi:D-sedoheptulose 7-phosphate isomerase
LNFTSDVLVETKGIIGAIDAERIDAMARALVALRQDAGRLFILGVGGSAGHPETPSATLPPTTTWNSV